jgi:hypothetical protein
MNSYLDISPTDLRHCPNSERGRSYSSFQLPNKGVCITTRLRLRGKTVARKGLPLTEDSILRHVSLRTVSSTIAYAPDFMGRR